MTPSNRINYWLKCRPLAEANQRMWIAAVLADGMKCGAQMVQDARGSNEQDLRSIAAGVRIKAQEMEEAGKV